MKLYHYTKLGQDGQKVDLGISKKKDFNEFREILSCQMIEIIPRDYFPDWMNKRASVYGDEEGRFMMYNIRNAHMKVLTDPSGHEWDCVGDLILEEVHHGEN